MANERPHNAYSLEQVDRLLEQRFSSKQVAQNFDFNQPRQPVNPLRLTFSSSFDGLLKSELQRLLKGILAYTQHSCGLAISSVTYVNFYTKADYEKRHKPIPDTISLPASSLRKDASGDYQVTVIIGELSAHELEFRLFTVMRAALARILSDIYLRETIFPTFPGYSRPIVASSVDQSAKIYFLMRHETGITELEERVQHFAQQNKIAQRKQAHEAFLKGLMQQKLTKIDAQFIDNCFTKAVQNSSATYSQGLISMLSEVLKTNNQANFLPVTELAHFYSLMQRPEALLHAVDVRLGYLLNALHFILELAQSNEDNAATSELLKNYMLQFLRQKLARPSLVDATSDHNQVRLIVYQIHRQLVKFNQPHTNLQQLEERLRQQLSQRLYNFIHILYCRSQGMPFSNSDLRSQQANLAWHAKQLDKLYAQVGVWIDIVDSQSQKKPNLASLIKAWAVVVPHFVVIDYCRSKGEHKLAKTLEQQGNRVLQREMQLKLNLPQINLAKAMIRMILKLPPPRLKNFVELFSSPSRAIIYALGEILHPQRGQYQWQVLSDAIINDHHKKILPPTNSR